MAYEPPRVEEHSLKQIRRALDTQPFRDDYSSLIDEVAAGGQLDSLRIDELIARFESMYVRPPAERRVIAWILGYARMSDQQAVRAVAALSKSVELSETGLTIRTLARVGVRLSQLLALIAAFGTLYDGLVRGNAGPFDFFPAAILLLVITWLFNSAVVDLGRDATVSGMAIASLGRRGRTEGLPALLGIDTNSSLRFSVAIAIERILRANTDSGAENPPAVARVVRFLDLATRGAPISPAEGSGDFALDMIDTLGKVCGTSAIATLRRVSSRRTQPEARRNAARAAIESIEVRMREGDRSGSLPRASASAPVDNEELLRTAGRVETPKEQLLRPTTGIDPE